MQKIRVGVLGSGDVGRALARGFAGLGHDVRIGSREPEKLRDFIASEGGAHITSGTFAEAARFGDAVVLATLGTGTESAIRMAGIDAFDGKVVIDTTNPLDFSTGMPRLSIGQTDSLGEVVQRLLPNAHVVKAFNTVGNALMVNPQLAGGPPDMFIAGNDADAKKFVAQICEHFGWGVVDLGGVESSRYLEPMCLAWVMHGILSKSWKHAFKLLRE
jgi:predicted dinucleotide-binding enzyme